MKIAFLSHIRKIIYDRYRWKKLKREIYFSDGSLRDIYVLNISESDWRKWIRHVNENYKLEWFNGLAQKSENFINEQIAIDYLNRKHDLCSSVSIYLGKIQLNSHFFNPTEIENDISPNDITCLEDHNTLMKYMIDASCLLGKEVILTPEYVSEPSDISDLSEIALLKVNNTVVDTIGYNAILKKYFINK